MLTLMGGHPRTSLAIPAAGSAEHDVQNASGQNATFNGADSNDRLPDMCRVDEPHGGFYGDQFMEDFGSDEFLDSTLREEFATDLVLAVSNRSGSMSGFGHEDRLPGGIGNLSSMDESPGTVAEIDSEFEFDFGQLLEGLF